MALRERTVRVGPFLLKVKRKKWKIEFLGFEEQEEDGCLIHGGPCDSIEDGLDEGISMIRGWVQDSEKSLKKIKIVGLPSPNF